MEIKPYEIEFLDNVTKNDIPALPVTIEGRINRAIRERLTVSPDKLGKALHHEFKGSFRLRVGDYRIIYEIEIPERKVLITAIRHRKDVYER
ncbi:type II toxin-antitoxin system RelE/ParE family toxin [Wolbachia endosymbiont (group E) of Neria commutata]|uniref:type II toxin-antitoxin system RelE family toxin n=1 Tax=Wolbachia endosymbiont (group E) of Neria commutata TaxID=3066149 RepID=UPI003132A9FF